MINGGVVVDALVAALRAIPGLVEEMEGDSSRISIHSDAYPREASVARALYELRAPGMLVVYRGYGYRSGREGRSWLHYVSVFVKCRRTESSDAAGAQHRALWLLVEGVPVGYGGQKLLLTEIVPECFSMELPTCDRRSQVADPLGNTIDYWEFQSAFAEKTDS